MDEYMLATVAIAMLISVVIVVIYMSYIDLTDVSSYIPRKRLFIIWISNFVILLCGLSFSGQINYIVDSRNDMINKCRLK